MGGLQDNTHLQEREISDELIRADTLFCQRGWAGCKGPAVKQEGLVRVQVQYFQKEHFR